MHIYPRLTFFMLAISPYLLAGTALLVGMYVSYLWQLPAILAMILAFIAVRTLYLGAHPNFLPSFRENLPIALLIVAMILAFICGHTLSGINWLVLRAVLAIITMALATAAVWFQLDYLTRGGYRPQNNGRYVA